MNVNDNDNDSAEVVVNFKPAGDRVLVRRENDDDYGGPMLHGGVIHTPGVSREKPAEGAVLSVGPGKLLDNGTIVPVRVAVGDHVVFGKYAGMDIKIGNEELTVLRDDEILGTITKRVEVDEAEPETEKARLARSGQ